MHRASVLQSKVRQSGPLPCSSEATFDILLIDVDE
jgi:hypothetical protein